MKSIFATRILVVICAAVFVAATVHGQSFNVDVDIDSLPVLGGGAPSSSYGAASGQTGNWNAYPAANGVAFALDDLSGLPTAATITRSTAFGSVLGFNNGTFSGDYALLMKDAAQVGTLVQGGLDDYVFNNLVNGRYQIWTYGAPPQGSAGFTPVDVLGSADPVQILTGNAVNNTFVLGQTHAVHDVLVNSGTLTVRIDVPPNAGAAAYISGFQLIAVPTPAGIALLAMPVLFKRRRRN